MIKILFSAAFILSLMMLLFLVFYYKKHISSYYTLLFCAITIENFGYMQLVSAQGLSCAISANQVIYLGASFYPLLSYLCIADLCKKPMKPVVSFLFSIVGMLILGGALTIGKLPIYYKNVELVRTAQFSYLEKEYGPLHALFPFNMLGLMVAATVLILTSFRRRKKISYVTPGVLIAIMIPQIVVYVYCRIGHLKIDLLPLTFVFLQAGVLVLLRRIKLYDVSGITGLTMAESKNYGFIVFSEKGRLAGIDEAAKEWFPELDELYIDSRITDCTTDFLKQLDSWLSGGDEGGSVHFERDGRIIKASHTFINKSGTRLHCITLADDTDEQKYARLIENYNKDLEIRVNEKTARLSEIQNDIILSMASIVENRDNNTGGHIKRTSDIVRIFVDHLITTRHFGQLDDKTAEAIIKAAPLHDLGKIAIPDVILNKPGKFTEEEYAQMKKHSEKGAVIVSGILKNSDDMQFKQIAENIAHYHHEKYNGTGYPSGLKGWQIPFEARVMALADVFDALVSKRVYKERFSYDRAFEIIESSSGEHFDPKLCVEFLKCRSQLEELYNSYAD